MRQINLDCEGPITKNDNALELCQHFLPEGKYFFSLISKYDDFLADILKRKNHKAGSTLKLILPFLKAYGVTNKKIKEYSLQNLRLIPGAREVISSIKDKMPTFIISTSYQPYIGALCEYIDFPLKNTYFTSLNLDKYTLPQDEIKRLKELVSEILTLPQINLSGVKKERDLLPPSKRTIQGLDEIFAEEILHMECGKMLKEVNPLGGEEKAKAVLDSLKRTGGKPSDIMYIGDSITDVKALLLVKREGGVSISFNGNGYAIRSAEIACISPHAFPLFILADVFNKEGKEGILRKAITWPQGIDRKLKKQLFAIMPFPRAEIISEDNEERLIQESEEMRKGIRGKIIGELG